jgi:PRTRC genetic system protein E
MFTELMPLIKDRPLTLTVCALTEADEGRIRVNVVPKEFTLGRVDAGFQNKDLESQKKVLEIASKTLNTPLSMTGTPEELDAELPRAIVEYVESLAMLTSNITEVKTAIADAHKLIEDAKKAKTAGKVVKGADVRRPVATADDKKRSGGPTQAPDAFTLFDTAGEANRAATPVAVSAADVPVSDDDLPVDVDDVPVEED